MTRALPRTHFHSSNLLRCLSDLALVDPATGPGHAFAEKLGLWLNFTDAINLFAAHNTSVPQAQPRARAAQGASPGSEVARLRTALAQAIARSCAPSPAKARTTAAVPALEMPHDPAAALETCRRTYLALQRDMDQAIAPLRARVRELVARASPALKKLALLDAAFDAILKEREGRLLAGVPVLLEERFTQLLDAHQHTLAHTGCPDDPQLWRQPGAWLAHFYTDMQTVLLAELDLRLQPTLGLVEAFHHANSPPP